MNLELIGSIITACYFLGSIPTGYLVGRAKGIDIRQHGSKNIGATNVFRTLGKGPGIFVFACDVVKGVLGVLLAQWLARHMPLEADSVERGGAIIHHIAFMQPAIAGIIGSVACILGHNFPVWLKFKGGKGVATSLGTVVGLVPLAAAIAFALWLLVLFATGYVSLASILGAISVPVSVAFTAQADEKMVLVAFFSFAALLIVLRHRPNIQRLMNGTENRFRKPKNENPS